MAFDRYPHLGTISYITGAPSQGTTGVYVPGTSTSIAVNCRVEVNKSSMIIDEHGNRVDYALNVFCPKQSFAESLQDGKSTFHFSGKEHTVVNVPPLQQTTVLRCK